MEDFKKYLEKMGERGAKELEEEKHDLEESIKTWKGKIVDLEKRLEQEDSETIKQELDMSRKALQINKESLKLFQQSLEENRYGKR